jgi:hypothetical protein
MGVVGGVGSDLSVSLRDCVVAHHAGEEADFTAEPDAAMHTAKVTLVVAIERERGGIV